MPLTNNQLKKLAGKLHGTSENVHDVVQHLFGCNSFTDTDFDLLEKEGGVFKCDNCDEWKNLDHKDKYVSGYCSSCADFLDE